jgi:hypothetical protein
MSIGLFKLGIKLNTDPNGEFLTVYPTGDRLMRCSLAGLAVKWGLSPLAAL